MVKDKLASYAGRPRKSRNCGKREGRRRRGFLLGHVAHFVEFSYDLARQVRDEAG